MEHILYWLWLTTKYGVTPSKIKVLLEYFKTVEEIYFVTQTVYIIEVF